jgi:hypothetical protein
MELESEWKQVSGKKKVSANKRQRVDSQENVRPWTSAFQILIKLDVILPELQMQTFVSKDDALYSKRPTGIPGWPLPS